MTTESNHTWYPFDDGKTIGQVGSEHGVIVEDIEHPLGARITIEKGGSTAPYEITLGVYQLLFHTHFSGTEEESYQFVNDTKKRIENLFDHLSIQEDSQDKAWNEIFNTLTGEICEQTRGDERTD